MVDQLIDPLVDTEDVDDSVYGVRMYLIRQYGVKPIEDEVRGVMDGMDTDGIHVKVEDVTHSSTEHFDEMTLCLEKADGTAFDDEGLLLMLKDWMDSLEAYEPQVELLLLKDKTVSA